MQTFVPHTSFPDCAAVLDLSRLGKQIIEAQQIFKALTQPDYGWQHHPAVKMWRGSELCLVMYAKACNDEWRKRRGRSHGAYDNLMTILSQTFVKAQSYKYPRWWGNELVHESHRSNLVRKNPEHYRQFFPDVPLDLPYVWPEA